MNTVGLTGCLLCSLMMREGSPLSLEGTGDLWKAERQQMSLCEAAPLGRETLRKSCMMLCCLFYVASAVPRSGKAYCSMPALACGMSLIILNERGRVAKGEIFDEIA